MTLFSVEACGQKRAHEVGGEARADHLRAEAEDVHVVVLDSLVRGVDVMTDGCPDTGDLARGDGGADAGAADENAALGLTILDGRAELGRLVGVVDPHRVGVGAEVYDLVPLLAERLENPVPQVDSPVVERDSDLHVQDRT